MTEETLRSCKFCRHSNVNTQGDNVMMSCRRNPPVVMFAPVPKRDLAGGVGIEWIANTTFPTVNEATWCGEWQAGKPTAVANQPTIQTR